MGWVHRYYPLEFGFRETRSAVGAFSVNEKCFIRKEHKCGKLFGASKSCFIACPTQEEIEIVLNLISEKLTKANIEPIIAVKERAYGQDIFCTKICGKIIESRFCIVILDDEITMDKNIPNPNVYYEYGVMTSIRKHIIPLQKENLRLAFNIQSYDTIKYNSMNIGTELDRAIRDAIRITEATEHKQVQIGLSDKTLLRRFEVAGFELKDEKWFLSDVIDDTNFRGFGYHNNEFYTYIGKVDDDNDVQEYIDDMNVAIYRTEKKAKDLLENKESSERRLETLKVRREEIERSARPNISTSPMRASVEREMAELTRVIQNTTNRLDGLTKLYIGFILDASIDLSDFTSKIYNTTKAYDRYEISFSDGTSLTIRDIAVDLSSSGH